MLLAKQNKDCPQPGCVVSLFMISKWKYSPDHLQHTRIVWEFPKVTMQILQYSHVSVILDFLVETYVCYIHSKQNVTWGKV
jgi:hypothetical protein